MNDVPRHLCTVSRDIACAEGMGFEPLRSLRPLAVPRQLIRSGRVRVVAAAFGFVRAEVDIGPSRCGSCNVNQLTGAGMIGSSRVVISTIQRVFALLRGQEVADSDDQDLAGCGLLGPDPCHGCVVPRRSG